MATLEKIRKRSVLLLIIIGAALVAFIIGDFLNSSRSIFGNGTTVANVDGNKIDYLAFQQRYSEFTEKNKNVSQQDAATVQNQVLGQMIQEALFNEEYDALGIDVTDKELSNYMYKQMAMSDREFAQTLGQLAQSLASNEKAAALLNNATTQEMAVQNIRKIIFNPTQFGLTTEQVQQAQLWWLSKENDAVEQIKQTKFAMLFRGSIQANALEIEAMRAQRMNSYDVQMVSLPYAAVNDNDYKVSDDEVKAVYEQEKYKFPVDEESCLAYYIAVPINPSADDLAKADKLLARVDSALHATQGLDGVRTFSELSINERSVRQKDLSSLGMDAKQFVDSGAVVGQISKVFTQGDNRTIYRLLAKTQEIDSVKVIVAQVEGDKKKQDAALADLNAGKAVKEVKCDTTEMDIFAASQQGMLSDEQKAKILAGGDNYFVVDSNEQGASICKVLEKKAAKTVVKLGEISYMVDPSKDTRANLLNELQKFVDGNNTAQKFFDNAAKAAHSYTAMSDVVASSQAMLGNSVKGTSKLIQWLFKDAKEGEVSAIQTDNDQLVVAALAKKYDGDYRPVSDPEVKAYCETVARNHKKADALAKKYAGKAKDLAGYAKVMGCTVDAVSVGAYPTAEAALDGQVPFAKVGQVYGPVKGENALFVYSVVKKNAAVNKIEDSQLAGMCQQQLGQAVSSNFWQLIKGGKDVDNNIVNFR